MLKLGRGPVGFDWCLHRTIRQGPREGTESGSSFVRKNVLTPYRYLLPGEPTSGHGGKGRGSERDALGKLRWNAPAREGLAAVTRLCSPVSVNAERALNYSYLVDPASSHMLVSKIKPCMSKYKHLYCETANGSLNQLSFIWWSLATWIPVVILELIHATTPDSWKGGIY